MKRLFAFIVFLLSTPAWAIDITSVQITSGTPSREDFAVDGIEKENGEMLVAWGNGTYNTDPRAIYASTSTDGVTWGPIFVLQDVAGKWDTEPQFFKQTGELFFWSTICNGTVPDTCYVTYKKSTDNGATWGAANDIVSSDYLVTTGNPIKKTIAPNIGRIIVPLQTGTPASNIFWATCLYSDDNGVTWIRGGDIAAGDNHSYTEPTMVERTDGSLYAILRHYFFDNGGRFQYYSTSSDGGVTWSTPAQSPLVSNNAMAKIVQSAPGEYTAVWNEKDTSASLPRSPLVTMRSTDNLASFVGRRYLRDDDGRHYSNMGLFVRSNGNIVSVYDDETSLPFKIYYAEFTNGAVAMMSGQFSVSGGFLISN